MSREKKLARGLGGPRFINVDLEVWSRTDLADLNDAIQEQAFVLYAGKARRKYLVSFEARLVRPSSPEKAIWALLTIVDSLPPAARRAWKSAQSRVFNIGYDGGEFITVLRERPVGSGQWRAVDPERAASACETSLSPKLLTAVAKFGGTIATTIYPPTRQERASK